LANDFNQITEYDFFAPATKENPYPAYAWLRAEHPVYHNERLGFYALSRFADVLAASRNPQDFSSTQGIGPERQPTSSMISQDPPNHTRLRTLVSKAFTPKTIGLYEERVQQIVDELLDAVIDKSSFDLVQDFAFPLPVIVIAEMLGVEAEHRASFKRWSDDVITVTGGDKEAIARYMKSWAEFKQFFSAKIEERRQEPREDLISALVQAQEDREALSSNEILNFCLLLLVAGNETTTNLISNGAKALFDNFEQAQKLREHPELIQSMVEEALRYDAPIQGTFRTNNRELEINGVTIPKDSKIVLLWGSANHDESQFPNPDVFDIERKPNGHMAFGMGIHVCLGAPLARLEARIATETILRRMRNIRLDPTGKYTRVDNPMFRGLHHFPVLFDKA
jgi:cytochrome P450